MSAHAIPAEANDNPGPHGPGPHDAGTQGYRQVLHDLISMGTNLARFLHAQAAARAAQQAIDHPAQQPTHAQQPPGAQPVAGAQPAPAFDALISLAAAFDRTARAVRRGILLARSLDKPVQPAHDPAGHRAAARRQIIRQVEDAIQRTGRGASDGQDGADTLQAELRDRLDVPDLDDDIGSRPAADIISEICRDLGLAVPPGSTRPWPRRTPEDIRQLCARAAAPSAARQPGAYQPGVVPQTFRCDAAQPGPIHPGSSPPQDPAGTLATILRHPPRIHDEWRPPPHA